MKTGIKIVLWVAVLGAAAFAGYKAYQLYKARQAAKGVK